MSSYDKVMAALVEHEWSNIQVTNAKGFAENISSAHISMLEAQDFDTSKLSYSYASRKWEGLIDTFKVTASVTGWVFENSKAYPNRTTKLEVDFYQFNGALHRATSPGYDLTSTLNIIAARGKESKSRVKQRLTAVHAQLEEELEKMTKHSAQEAEAMDTLAQSLAAELGCAPEVFTSLTQSQIKKLSQTSQAKSGSASMLKFTQETLQTTALRLAEIEN